MPGHLACLMQMLFGNSQTIQIVTERTTHMVSKVAPSRVAKLSARKVRLKVMSQTIIVRALVLVLAISVPASGLPFATEGNSGSIVSQDTHSCMGCHDGTLADNITSLDQSHSVGIDYRLAQIRSRGALRDPSLLDAAIKLENGQVGCTSCHDRDSQLRAGLVMSNAGSRLCFSCHNL